MSKTDNKIQQNRNGQFAEVVSMIHNTKANVISIANTALIDLYWNIGRYISEKISVSEWGDSVVKQLAQYIERNSPDTKGFSDKNLWRMKQFYETYCNDSEKLSPVVRQISWTNNLTIMSRAKSAEERWFYLMLCKNERLSKRELNRQIDAAIYERSNLGGPKVYGFKEMKELDYPFNPNDNNEDKIYLVFRLNQKGIEKELQKYTWDPHDLKKLKLSRLGRLDVVGLTELIKVAKTI